MRCLNMVGVRRLWRRSDLLMMVVTTIVVLLKVTI